MLEMNFDDDRPDHGLDTRSEISSPTVKLECTERTLQLGTQDVGFALRNDHLQCRDVSNVPRPLTLDGFGLTVSDLQLPELEDVSFEGILTLESKACEAGVMGHAIQANPGLDETSTQIAASEGLSPEFVVAKFLCPRRFDELTR